MLSAGALGLVGLAVYIGLGLGYVGGVVAQRKTCGCLDHESVQPPSELWRRLGAAFLAGGTGLALLMAGFMVQSFLGLSSVPAGQRRADALENAAGTVSDLAIPFVIAVAVGLLGGLMKFNDWGTPRDRYAWLITASLLAIGSLLLLSWWLLTLVDAAGA